MDQPRTLTAFAATDIAALDELALFAGEFARLTFRGFAAGEFVASHDSGLAFRVSGSGFGDGATGPAVTGIVERISVHDADGARYEIAGLGIPLHEVVATLAGLPAADGLAAFMAAGAVLTGSRGADRLVGFGGADVLAGGRGRDRLHGGADADSFVFSVKPHRKHADRIDDFEAGLDRLVLDRDVFARIGPAGGDLKAAKFAVADMPTKKCHRVVYDDDSGRLLYDKDGKGHRNDTVLIVKLDAHLDLDHRDLFVM